VSGRCDVLAQNSSRAMNLKIQPLVTTVELEVKDWYQSAKARGLKLTDLLWCFGRASPTPPFTESAASELH